MTQWSKGSEDGCCELPGQCGLVIARFLQGCHAQHPWGLRDLKTPGGWWRLSSPLWAAGLRGPLLQTHLPMPDQDQLWQLALEAAMESLHRSHDKTIAQNAPYMLTLTKVYARGRSYCMIAMSTWRNSRDQTAEHKGLKSLIKIGPLGKSLDW